MIFWSQKLAKTYYQFLESTMMLIPPHFSTQNQDMCHDTTGSSTIKFSLYLMELRYPIDCQWGLDQE